jgi:phosphoserine aminotransferase
MSPIKRVHNFNAGPSVLPLPVLEKAQAELLDYQGCGMSVMEMSHRSKEFEGIIQTAEADLRELLGIPANYKVMFLQGGASLQFAMLPMNLRPAGASADYIVTGSWSKTSWKESAKLGATCTAFNGEAENFTRLPEDSELKLDPKAAYLHFCHNETIHGVEFKKEPTPPVGVELVCDMSSDFLSQPVDISKYGLVYAGAQKNAGPAGVTVVIVREDLLQRVPEKLPVMLDYKVLAESGSLHNTPPCFAVYVTGLVMKWLKDLGGLPAIHKINLEKAGLIYSAIDSSGGFYRGHAVLASRSIMNIPFRMPSEELEETFVKEAKKADLIGLKGHRSVGGLRASIYNALSIESTKALVDFMADFQRRHG